MLYLAVYQAHDMFVTSLNAREADKVDWESVKGLLVEEFLKKEKRNPSNQSDEAPYTRGGGRAR